MNDVKLFFTMEEEIDRKYENNENHEIRKKRNFQ